MVGKERVVLTNDEQCELISITANCGLHPLIHTFPSVTSAQNVGGGSQQVSDHKLKYDMFSQTRITNCWAESSTLSIEILLEEDYK